MILLVIAVANMFFAVACAWMAFRTRVDDKNLIPALFLCWFLILSCLWILQWLQAREIRKLEFELEQKRWRDWNAA